MTALSGHLAGLLDQLSHPENAPTAGEPSVAEMLIVRTMTAHPAEPEELTLWRRSGADRWPGSWHAAPCTAGPGCTPSPAAPERGSWLPPPKAAGPALLPRGRLAWNA